MTSNTRITPERVGRIAAKVATQAAFVVTGLADVLAGTVQDVVRQGKHSYTERRAAGASPVGDYARQVPGQVKGLAGEVKDAYTALAARGRTVFTQGFSRTAHRPGPEQPEEYQQPPAG